MNDWKIYTKTGDKGETSLLGGRRVPKYHLKIQAYGTIDELSAFVGLLHDHITDNHNKKMLLNIQERLLTAESLVAHDKKAGDIALPQLVDQDVKMLELEIDRMNEHLPALSHFIIPGGHPAVSSAHVARCVCRRAERIILELSHNEPVQEIIIRYFNRLSDYFFVLARKLAQDLGVEELQWLPDKKS